MLQAGVLGLQFQRRYFAFQVLDKRVGEALTKISRGLQAHQNLPPHRRGDDGPTRGSTTSVDQA